MSRRALAPRRRTYVHQQHVTTHLVSAVPAKTAPRWVVYVLTAVSVSAATLSGWATFLLVR